MFGCDHMDVTIWDANDRTLVGCVQGKSPTRWTTTAKTPRRKINLVFREYMRKCL